MCLDVINQTWTALYGEFGHGIFLEMLRHCLKKNVVWLFLSDLRCFVGNGKGF